jgi:hypothetical protein
MRLRSGRRLAVAAGVCAFMIAELAFSEVLAIAWQIAGHGETVDAIVPWVALVLLFVGIRIGITVKRAVARRLQQPSATGADQP